MYYSSKKFKPTLIKKNILVWLKFPTMADAHRHKCLADTLPACPGKSKKLGTKLKQIRIDENGNITFRLGKSPPETGIDVLQASSALSVVGGSDKGSKLTNLKGNSLYNSFYSDMEAEGFLGPSEQRLLAVLSLDDSMMARVQPSFQKSKRLPMERRSSSCTIVVVIGCHTDLAMKQIFPSLNSLHCKNALPPNCFLVGYGRTGKTGGNFQTKAFSTDAGEKVPVASQNGGFAERVHYVQGEFKSEGLRHLHGVLQKMELEFDSSHRVFCIAANSKHAALLQAITRIFVPTDHGGKVQLTILMDSMPDLQLSTPCHGLTCSR